MLGIKQNLHEDGFALLQSAVSSELCALLKVTINERLQQLIKQHGCFEQDYFSTVNRWPLSALVESKLQHQFLNQLTPIVYQLTDLTLRAYEVDVLYKSIAAPLPIPCHQDIAYVFNRPYLLSSWIALDEVPPEGGALQFLPRSHQWPLSPAIDFWQPHFIDMLYQTEEWQRNAVTMTAAIGDAVIFSSRVWHRSCAYQLSHSRMAIVVRWGNESIPYETIPLPPPVRFGMWNCGDYTQRLLRKGLQVLFNQTTSHFLHAIHLWLQQLEQTLPFDCDQDAAFLSLKKLQLLNEAYQHYQGGDGQGVTYANVWQHFLEPLNTYLDNVPMTDPKDQL